MRLKRAVYIIIGCIGLGFGAIGVVLPVLPTVPFLMLAAFCFAKSSKRLHSWFTGTELYKKNLESFVQGRGMTLETKIRIMFTVSLIMSAGFVMMMLKSLYVPCMILGCVWLFHILYFVFGIKTLKETQN